MNHLRKIERRLSAAVLIAAPLAGLVGGLLTQDYGGEMSQELEYIATNNGRWLMANYFTLLMGVLMTVAIGIQVALVRQRAAALGYLGGVLAIVGIYFHGSVVGYSLVQAPLVGSTLPEDEVLTFTAGSMYDHAAFTTILIPFLGFFIGIILLAAALWRSGTVPAWVAVIMAVAPLTEFVGFRGVSPELMYVLLSVAFGYIAVGMLRAGDQTPAALPLVEAQQAD
jgi:hypothetical protein